MRHTEKALREALKFYAACVGVGGEEAFLDDRGEKARAALSLPETQGEPVGENLEPLPPEVHEAINAYAAYYAEHHKLGMSIRNDMQYIASVALRFALPSQPAQGMKVSPEGYNGAIAVAAAACAYLANHDRPGGGEQRYNAAHLYQISEELKRTIAMLAAAPAAPTQACRSDGRCQYAIDHGAEGLGHCLVGKCAMQAKPTNGEGA